MPGVNASTVYRTLSLLEEVGVLQHSHLETGAEYHKADEAATSTSLLDAAATTTCRSRRPTRSSRLIQRHHGFQRRPHALRDHRALRRLRGGREAASIA